MTKPTVSAPRLGKHSPVLRMGISRCLLGEQVRFDGGHKRNSFLTEALGQFVEWAPVCPEVEVGMGVPREPVRLVSIAGTPRLMAATSGIDHTRAMTQFSHRRVRELETLDLSGYVFKKDSPSCGIKRLRLFNRHGVASRQGVGMFAREFMRHLPLIPVEEEGRLSDPVLREHFIERIFAYRRWRNLMKTRITREALVKFHTVHKYQLLAHSRPHYQELGRLVADVARTRTPELAQRYGLQFMVALQVRVTTRKHVNALQHLVGHFTDELTKSDRAELHEVIDNYHQGLTPLVVPITLVNHYVKKLDVRYLQDQTYLNPHPKELMLRNRV